LSICYFTYIEEDNIDLIAEKGDETVAVQVETRKSNTKRNMLALKDYGADRKVVVATYKQADLKAREILVKLGKDSGIEICFVKNFISVLK
jgi:fructose-specific phosphotransferase system component IIB